MEDGLEEKKPKDASEAILEMLGKKPPTLCAI